MSIPAKTFKMILELSFVDIHGRLDLWKMTLIMLCTLMFYYDQNNCVFNYHSWIILNVKKSFLLWYMLTNSPPSRLANPFTEHLMLHAGTSPLFEAQSVFTWKYVSCEQRCFTSKIQNAQARVMVNLSSTTQLKVDWKWFKNTVNPHS